MLQKALVSIGIVSGVILAVILNTTTPVSAGAFGILAVFVLTYLCLVSVMTFGVHGVSRITAYASHAFAPRRPAEVISLQRAYYYSTIVALAPVIIISMQSVGGVGPYELLLIAILIILGCVYVTKRTAQ